MASSSNNDSGSQLLVVGNSGGITVIDPSTPLKRLNYFDGKFLRAADFDVEQSYLRHLVAISNQGLGAGVVYGYDTVQGSGDNIQIGPGLAIDPSGKVLLLQSAVTQSVQALIDASRRTATSTRTDASGKSGAGTFNDCIEVAAPPPTAVVPISDIYVIAICSAEALCGQEDVYGVLCADACVGSSDRPYRLDGIVVRAIPLQLVTPFPTSKAVAIDADKYLRSKLAHSWFADEVLKHPNAVSRDGLLSDVWCLGAGYDSSCCEVPLAVVARAGSTTLFLDAWTLRRERIDAPAKRYWQWKMRMRPWDVFLAQILQFQCQLADLLGNVVVPGSRAGDPCAAEREALREATQFIEQVRAGLASYRDVTTNATASGQPALMLLSLTGISDLRDRLQVLLKSSGTYAQTKDRVLIRGGIIELPPAGYLPVVTGSNISVNEQVRALLGEGLDLRFCIASADYIAHEVEKAQHMDRISLLQGLDDPDNKPHVDILVPDGQLASGAVTPGTGLYDARLRFSSEQTGGLVEIGAAREEVLPSGGTALYTAAAGLSQSSVTKFQTAARSYVSSRSKKAATLTPNLDGNAFIDKAAVSDTEVPLKLTEAVSMARAYTAASGSADATAALDRAKSSARDTADGLWIDARTDKQLRTLAVNDEAAVSLRVVLASHPAAPLAMELTFHGSLLIKTVSTASASGVLALGGTLNGIVSIGMLKEDQSEQKVTEYLITERFDWPAKLSFRGTDTDGQAILTLNLHAESGAGLRLSKRTIGGGAQIRYQLALVTTAAGAASETGTALSKATRLGELDLVADAGVINASNINHRYADSGLDLLQAALIVSEPAFKSKAAALLFPAAPAATPELVIQAVRDWVMFTKRREEKCARDVVPVVVPPRRYRVINYSPATLRAELASNNSAGALIKALQDPATQATAIQRLITLQDRAQLPKLVVTFAGGSATAQSDLVSAEADWKAMQPGNTIYFAAIGAAGETDDALQINRLKTFERAINADSHEDSTAQDITLIPYPPAAVPDDADGIMLFITTTASTTEAMHVYGVNNDVYSLIRKDAEAKKLPAQAQWAGYLKKRQINDFTLANYTAADTGVSAIDDAAVLNAVRQQGMQPSGRTLLLSRSGDDQSSYSNRSDAGKKVVTDLGGNAAALEALTYGGTWPVGDAPSALFVEVQKIDVPR